MHDGGAFSWGAIFPVGGESHEIGGFSGVGGNLGTLGREESKIDKGEGGGGRRDRREVTQSARGREDSQQDLRETM